MGQNLGSFNVIEQMNIPNKDVQAIFVPIYDIIYVYRTYAQLSFSAALNDIQNSVH